MRASLALLLFFSPLLALSGPADAQTEPVVTITAVPGGPTTLTVGQTISIAVEGSVTNPAGPEDGIVAFDQDFLVAPLGPPYDSPLAIESVTLAGAFTSTGSTTGNGNSSGVSDIEGFAAATDDTEGIASPVVLYTVTLKAIQPGVAETNPGPGSGNLGTDIVLNETGSDPGTYPPGPTITVVPEPASLFTVLCTGAVCFRRRGRGA